MTSMDQSLVSVILINYNTFDLTVDCLRSFSQSIYKNFELIVIDNASEEDLTSRFLEMNFPYEVRWYRSEVNLGFSGANNLGIRKSQGDIYFFINNDTEITPELIDRLLSTFSLSPNVGLVSPKILYFDSKIIQYAGSTRLGFLMRNRSVGIGEVEGLYTEIRKTSYAHGAAMMIKKTVVDRCGPMPEHYFLYYEELDWCETIKRMGYEIWVNQKATIFHKESMSIGKSNSLKTYYLTRNRLLFKKRNYSRVESSVFFAYYLLLLPIKVALYTIKREPDHAKAFFKAVLWHLKPHQS